MSDKRTSHKQEKKESTYKQNMTERKKQRGVDASITRKIVIVVLTLLTAIIVFSTITGYSYIKSALEPVDPADETTKNIEIPLGSSSSQIGQILEDNNIINDSTVFRFYIKFNNISEFQAGEYDLSPSMTLNEITDALQQGRIYKEPVLTVTIPEGKTVEQIAELFAEKAEVDKEGFLEKVSDESFVQQMINQFPLILSEEILNPEIIQPLEGYLFAATYEFYEEEPTVETIVTTMLRKTESVVTNHLGDIMTKEDWSVHEAITMAPLVEKEARTEEDRKRIAGVFYNRLEEGMMLQTDPTVAYAHGEHLERTMYVDLEIDSPYNTYQNYGLPIGPISNFGESSLLATIEPEETDYFYFLADYDGNVHYARTLDEHNQLISQYRN